MEVSLEPSNPPGKEPDLPLGQQIQRITHERGSFAKLNEQELASEQVEEQVEDVEIKEYEPSFDELRAQLAANVGTALNEAALNLDFVSLLVSASRPQAGESSISPMLKSQVPSQSFNADTVQTAAPSLPARCGYGWKVGAYGSSAKHLNSAAKTLQGSVKRERQFWKDMLYVSLTHGEVATRKMQLKYGYRDSGSMYFEKGVGTLQKGDDGHAVFTPATNYDNSLVEVSLYADTESSGVGSSSTTAVVPASAEALDKETPEPDRLIGCAQISYEQAIDGLEEPLYSIRSQRNRLFEHELMYHIIQESREKLASHRVYLLDGGKVVCELFGGRIEIKLAAPDPELCEGCVTDPARAINYSLHLLLTDHFHRNFKLQHSTPKPFKTKMADERKKGAGSSSILQPVLAHVQHSILVSRAIRLVQILLPDAQISDPEFVDDPNVVNPLTAAPQCISKITNSQFVIILDIRSPISFTDQPAITAEIDGPHGHRSTQVYDLTELELWMKWATK